MPKFTKLRKLITRGTDSALFEQRSNPSENYRTNSFSSSTSDSSTRPGEGTTRRNSASATVPGEDVAAIPSPQTGRRITSAYIFPSSTSLEASSHYSLSLTSLNSGSDPGHLPSSLEHQPHHGREDIHQISQDVPRFVTAASSLQECLTMKKESVRDAYILAHFEEHQKEMVRQKLLELVRMVKEILSYHRGMRSTSVLSAVHKLSMSFNGAEGAEGGDVNWRQNCQSALNAVIETFNTSMQLYTQGDHEHYREREQPPHAHAHLGHGHQPQRNLLSVAGSQGSAHGLMKSKGMSKSYESLSSSVLEGARQDVSFVDDLDQAMMTRLHAVDVTTSHCKLRSKYLKTIIGYLNKRAQMENDFYRQMVKLRKNTQEVLNEMDVDSKRTLPLLGLFRDSVDADFHFAHMSHMTFSLEVHQKLAEPLSAMDRKNEKTRKELKDNWAKEQKKLNDAKAALNNSCHKYMALGSEIVKASQVVHEGPPHKQEKKKKELLDLRAKFAEAEQTYKRLVQEANACQYQVHMAQKSILCAFRRMVIDSDHALRSDFKQYFDMQHKFFQQFPERRQKLSADTQHFVPGRQFHRYIQSHPEMPEEPQDYYFEEFMEERVSPTGLVVAPSEPDEASFASPPHIGTVEQSPTSNGHVSNTPLEPNGSITVLPPEEIFSPSDTEGSLLHVPKPRRGRAQPRERPQSFYGRSSPRQHKETSVWKGAITNLTHARGYGGASSVSDLRQLADAHDSGITRKVKMSRNAETHKFHKLETPAKCRECDTQVYFDGVECRTCELVAHQRCLESLNITCGTKLLKRRLSTFGVDLQRHLDCTQRNIPFIVTKCISELESRALDVQGLYRLSGSKTRMERICQLFEAVAGRVDFSEQNPHLVANVLKHYLKRLPEPLMTFSLYQDFIDITKESLNVLPMKDGQCSKQGKDLLKRLNSTLSELPPENYMTLALIIFHLRRVASHSDKNLMSESNLAIVFGPNLLKPRGSQSSIAALTDLTHQTNLVEIMIHHADQLFTTPEEEVWKHATKEVVVEEAKEVYIPVEQQQHGSLVHMDSESFDDDDMDILPNTPPERRLSVLFDLDTILLTIGGDDDEVLATSSQTSLGARRASEPNLLEPSTNYSAYDLLSVPHRGSGCKSSLSMQRQLTPVGEEQASTASHSTKQADNKAAEMHSEVAIMTVSENDSDGSDEELQTCSLGSPLSLPMNNQSEDDASHFGSTYSLPLRNVTPSSVELEYCGSLDRRERIRKARRWDRAHTRPSCLVGAGDFNSLDRQVTGGKTAGLEQNWSFNDSTCDQDETGSIEAEGYPESPEGSSKVSEEKLAAEEAPEPKKMESPVRADFLSNDTSVESSPGRRSWPEMKESGTSESIARTDAPQTTELTEDVVLGDTDQVYSSAFKRDDASRIGLRHSYPLRARRKAQKKSPSYSEQLSAYPLSTSGCEQTAGSHPNCLIEAEGTVLAKEGSVAVTDRGRHNRSESSEKDSLSDHSLHYPQQTPDSGNESAVTISGIRVSSSEGDFLQADHPKSVTAATSIDDGDDGIGISPLVNCEKVFDLRPPTDTCMDKQEAMMLNGTEALGMPHDDVVSDTSVEIVLSSRNSLEDSSDKHRRSTDEAAHEEIIPNDCVFDAEDKLVEEREMLAEGVEGSNAEALFGSEVSLTDHNFSGNQEGLKSNSSDSTLKGTSHSSDASDHGGAAAWKSIDIQFRALERADLFPDTFREEDKVSYGSIVVPSSSCSRDAKHNQRWPELRRRTASEADLLAEHFKSWGSVPVTQRIEEWNRRGERFSENSEEKSLKRLTRSRMVQSMYVDECDHMDASDGHMSRSLDDTSYSVGDVVSINNSSRVPQRIQVEIRTQRRNTSSGATNPPCS